MINNQSSPVKPRSAWWKSKPAVGIAAAIVGVVIGVSGQPPATEYVEVEKVVETPAKTVTVEKVPAACLAALDDADKVITLAGEALGYAGDGVGAVQTLDVDALERAEQGMASVSPKLSKAGDAYQSNRAKCRKSAK